MIHKFPFLTKTLRAISVQLQTEITNSLSLYWRNNQLNVTENISNVIAKFSKNFKKESPVQDIEK